MRRHYRKSPFKFKIKKDMVYSLIALALIACSGIIILSFSPQGQLLTRIAEALDNKFGIWRAILAIIFLLTGLLFTGVRWKWLKVNVIIGLIIFWIGVLGIAQGGELGSLLWTKVENYLSTLGALVIFFLFLVLGASLTFNISLGELLDMVTDLIKQTQKLIQVITTRKTKNSATQFVRNTEVVNKQNTSNNSQVIKSNNEGKPFIVNSPPSITTTIRSEKQMVAQNNPVVDGQAIIWKYPPPSLLVDSIGGKADRGDPKTNANTIEKTLDSFGITARVAEVNPGPAVTQYALEIALGTKVSKITALQNDLALALAAKGGQIRVEAPIPGRSLVGIEIPNRSPEYVPIRRLLESDIMQRAKSKLTVALGLDVGNNPIVADIAKMPHILIAGATGSGKSVCINTFLMSLLYRNSPQELKLILVDPKRVELTPYNGIPHLMVPVIVELDKILSALKWAQQEMERRYKLFASAGVRNIENYNETAGFVALPYLLIVIDELADIMMFAPVEVEDLICRIAQMARATGIHLVLSTQSPRVDIITGLIKANIPARISFNVTSMIDSRVIIDSPGAEKLLGKGDMLYIPPDQSKPTRIQGTFVSDSEVHKLVDYLKNQGVPVEYTEEVTSIQTVAGSGKNGSMSGGGEGHDQLFDEAVRFICQYDRASASLLQRKLSIGYARAARILDQLEQAGIVGPGEGSKPRDVLVRNAEEYFKVGQPAPLDNQEEI